VDGTVTKIVNFGAFVRVKDGLEGLIHISESLTSASRTGDVVHEGQTLKLKIISLDPSAIALASASSRPRRHPSPRVSVGRDRSGAATIAPSYPEPEVGSTTRLAAPSPRYASDRRAGRRGCRVIEPAARAHRDHRVAEVIRADATELIETTEVAEVIEPDGTELIETTEVAEVIEPTARSSSRPPRSPRSSSRRHGAHRDHRGR